MRKIIFALDSYWYIIFLTRSIKEYLWTKFFITTDVLVHCQIFTTLLFPLNNSFEFLRVICTTLFTTFLMMYSRMCGFPVLYRHLSLYTRYFTHLFIYEVWNSLEPPIKIISHLIQIMDVKFVWSRMQIKIVYIYLI